MNHMNEGKILFLLMGGTIDSTWDGKLDTAVTAKESKIPGYLSNLIIYPQYEFVTVCMKDSRQIAQEDLDALLSHIEKTQAKRIIVTHGTYTMPDTARFIETNMTKSDKVIVFTGSYIPLDGFYPTDAPFNLGFATAKVQNLTPGVYICINGETFVPSEVIKSLSEGKFKSIFKKGSGQGVQ